jgi:thiamine biosynthesis lipoprotein
MRYGVLAFAIPTGILTFAHACDAQTFQTEEQALRSLYGGCRVDRQDKTLSEQDRQALSKATGMYFPEAAFTFLVTQRDGRVLGYNLVMNEIGKSEPITFMVAMSPEYRVVDVLVMVFRESRGSEIREKRFLRQFQGKRMGDPLTINNDIVNYSGATLSSKAITRGVKRALALLRHFYPAPQSTEAVAPAFILPVIPLPEQAGMYRQVRYAMGTLCEIRMCADSSAHASAAAASAFSEIRRLEKIFSAYDPASELSRINREASTAPVPVSDDMWALSRAAVRYGHVTRGAVDITVRPLLKALESGADLRRVLRHVGITKVSHDPRHRTIRFMAEGMEMDFGGIAKGYAAQRAVALLRRRGISSALVNLGGSSIVTSGMRDWVVGIADPSSPNQYAAIATMKPDTAITCSGTYERCFETANGVVSHIVDPRTAQPLTGLRAAVAITRSAVAGEVLSKTILLDGESSQSAREYLLVTGTTEGPAVRGNLRRTALYT